MPVRARLVSNRTTPAFEDGFSLTTIDWPMAAAMVAPTHRRPCTRPIPHRLRLPRYGRTHGGPATHGRRALRGHHHVGGRRRGAQRARIGLGRRTAVADRLVPAGGAVLRRGAHAGGRLPAAP